MKKARKDRRKALRRAAKAARKAYKKGEHATGTKALDAAIKARNELWEVA